MDTGLYPRARKRKRARTRARARARKRARISKQPPLASPALPSQEKSRFREISGNYGPAKLINTYCFGLKT